MRDDIAQNHFASGMVNGMRVPRKVLMPNDELTIGKRKFTYDLWGDTVNVASRMESSGMPGAIHVSESTYQALQGDFVFESRGLTTCKGIGDVPTYFLKHRRSLVWNQGAA